MTIVFLARRFYPLIGGVEKHVMEVSSRLVGLGHKVIVVTESEGSYGNEAGIVRGLRKTSDAKRNGHRNLLTLNESIDGIEVIRIPVGKEDKFKKFRIWKEMWKLKDVIEQADVIHCHDVFFWYLPFRLLFPRKSVYTTFHGYESYPIRKSAIVVRKFSEKLSKGNICIGDFIRKWYGTAPTFVSYGAVESSEGSYGNEAGIVRGLRKTSDVKRNGHRDPLTLNESPRRESALFFGRLDDQTGVLTYVKAFELLKKKFPKFELLVVGDGEQKKLIEKKVKTLGFQKSPEKYFEKYNFAFVSRYLSILEAFAAKRLVVAVYDNPVKEDYLRMAPYAKWIVIEKDPKMIAKRLEDILANPQKEQEMVDASYKWVKKQTWEEMVKMYLKLWNC